MTTHVSDEQLIAYLLDANNYPLQEQIALELEECQTCQQRLEDLLPEYHAIEQSVVRHLSQKKPTAQANFAVIAPQLRMNQWWGGLPMKNFAFAGVTIFLLITAFALINNYKGNVSLSLYRPVIEPSSIEVEPTATIAAAEVTSSSVERVPLDSLLKNGDFEASQNGRLSGWTRTGVPAHEYEGHADTTIFAEGTTSGFFASTTEDPQAFGLLRQWFPANGYQGQRVRLTAQLKTEGVTGHTGLWTLQSAPGFEYVDWMQAEMVTGTTDWQTYSLVWDVPKNASMIELGLVLFGAGKVWIDDFNLEAVDKTIQLAGHENKLWWGADNRYQLDLPAPTQFTNLDFEDDFVKEESGWLMSERHYGFKHDKTEFATGSASGSMESRSPNNTHLYGVLLQIIKADAFRGERLRLTAQLKTQMSQTIDNKNLAGIWMRIDEGDEVVAFDNMHDRPVTGNTDWMKYEIVLDVPENSTLITIGAMLVGNGKVWLDDVQVEVVSEDVPVTATLPATGYSE